MGIFSIFSKKNNDHDVATQNSTEKVENKKFTAILLGPDEEIIGQMPTSITKLDVGEQFNTQVVLDGDLTAVKQIKLIER